jgi:purine-binding chemotaxis protein CheW
MQAKHDDFLVFCAGAASCALPLCVVEEIVFLPELLEPPTRPPFLAGLLNLEGKAVPVVDLARLFGLTHNDAGLYTPVVVIRVSERSVGLLISGVAGLAGVAAESSLPLPLNDSFKGCVTGAFHWHDEGVVVLSPERIFLHQEVSCMETFRELERRRLGALEVAPS